MAYLFFLHDYLAAFKGLGFNERLNNPEKKGSERRDKSTSTPFAT